MSWTFSAIGKASAVASAARKAKAQPACAEPEESYRLDCLDGVARMAESIVGDVAVQVSAGGSMWKDGDELKSHSIQLEFKPIYGFVV